MNYRHFGTKTGSLLALFVAFLAQANAFDRARVLPAMVSHLETARTSMNQGAWQEAIAYTQLIRPEKLRVAYHLDEVPENQVEECLEAVRQGISLWSEGLGFELDVQEVEPYEDADVNIHFMPEVRYRGALVGGYINWRHQILRYDSITFKANVTAEISLCTNQPNGKRMNLDQMRHAAAHEFGHVLGLTDSRHRGDIMGPLDLRRPAKHARIAEIDALRDLQHEAAVIRAQVFLTTLSKFNLVS